MLEVIPINELTPIKKTFSKIHNKECAGLHYQIITIIDKITA